MSEHHQHRHDEATPAPLQPIHQRLLDDGGAWRAQFPPSAAFRHGVEAFARMETTRISAATTAADVAAQRREAPGVKTAEVVSFAPPSARSSSIHHLAPGRSQGLSGLLVVAAILTLAALFGVVLRQLPTSGPAQRHPATATPAAGAWRNVGQFQAHANERVAVAPSDPHVVYRLNTTTFTMERSDDGGATWRALILPAEATQSPRKSTAAFAINPVNARIVYLTVFGDGSATQSCPRPFAADGQRQGAYLCSLQYASVNGGVSWNRLTLPSQGRLTGMLSQVLGSPWAPLLPQGNRVYSLMTADAYAGVYRLVESDDGVTWRLADGDLAATGRGIVSYAASPSGETVWAALSGGTLWRSDDSGARWTRVAALQANQVPGLAAARTVAGKIILYMVTYSAPLGDIAPADVQVSSDGGRSWQHAPAAGVPEGQHAAPHLAMTRADGSLVLVFRTPEMNIAFENGILHDAAYYAWSPGADSWLQLTPKFGAEVIEQQWMALAPGTGNTETIWALIYRDPTLNYAGETYIKDGTYTIASCALGR